MTDISNNEDLTSSFEDLKRNARGNTDIAAWFKNHPQVFNGLAGAMPVVSLDVMVVEYLHYAREHAHNKNVMELTLNLKLSLRLQPPPFLAAYAVDPAKQDLVQVDHGYALELPLAEWAYATAICTAIFIELGGFNDKRPWINELEDRLDGHIQTHFPGIKMEGLRAMESAGLLPLTSTGDICTEGIVDLMFEGRGAMHCMSPMVPGDLAP